MAARSVPRLCAARTAALLALALCCELGYTARASPLASGACDVTASGAKGDNTTDDTAAIQAAIDGCHAKYPLDAVVRFPGPAAYRITSSVVLVSNTTLSLAANTSIVSAMTPTSPGVPATARCGTNAYWSSTGVFCAENITNSAIVGDDMYTSVLDGGGWPWYNAKAFGKGPRMYEPQWSSNLTLSHITFLNAPSWTVHPWFSDSVTAESIRILNPRFTPNTDGFDPDSCTNVVLRDSWIDTGDDGISIKSGNSTRQKDVMMPAANIHIYNSTILSRNVCVGSATFGGVYNVLVEDCTIGDDKGSSPWAIKYKSHGYLPGPMINHTYRRLRIGNIQPNSWQQPGGGTAFIIGLTYGHPPPVPMPPCPTMCPIFENVTFEDIAVHGAVTAGSIAGLPEDHLHHLTFRNVTFENAPTNTWKCTHVDADYVAEGVVPPLKCTA